jgi:hypothetical protein
MEKQKEGLFTCSVVYPVHLKMYYELKDTINSVCNEVLNSSFSFHKYIPGIGSSLLPTHQTSPIVPIIVNP